jgi:hypothetical protein
MTNVHSSVEIYSLLSLTSRAVTSSLPPGGVPWLRSFPPAQGEAGSWLDSPATPSDPEGLAAELGRLRAALYYWVAEGYPEAGRTMVATVRYAF